MSVSMYLNRTISVFSFLKAGTTKAKASFQWLLLYLQYTVWNLGAEIPCTEINNTNKTMLPDEPSSFGSIVAAARYKHCRVLHSLFTSTLFVFVAWGPKLGTCLQNVLFVSSIAPFSTLFSSVWRFQKKRIYLGQQGAKRGCIHSTLKPISSIIHTLYTEPKHCDAWN